MSITIPHKYEEQDSILSREAQINIDSCMAYFHPEENEFTPERIEAKMLDAMSHFADEVDPERNNGKSTELRGMYYAGDREGMYKYLDKFITL